jgi:hypothetical protein
MVNISAVNNNNDNNNNKPVIIGATGTISKSFRQYLAAYRESTISRDCRKQPYEAQRTHCGQC